MSGIADSWTDLRDIAAYMHWRRLPMTLAQRLAVRAALLVDRTPLTSCVFLREHRQHPLLQQILDDRLYAATMTPDEIADVIANLATDKETIACEISGLLAAGNDLPANIFQALDPNNPGLNLTSLASPAQAQTICDSAGLILQVTGRSVLDLIGDGNSHPALWLPFMPLLFTDEDIPAVLTQITVPEHADIIVAALGARVGPAFMARFAKHGSMPADPTLFHEAWQAAGHGERARTLAHLPDGPLRQDLLTAGAADWPFLTACSASTSLPKAVIHQAKDLRARIADSSGNREWKHLKKSLKQIERDFKDGDDTALCRLPNILDELGDWQMIPDAWRATWSLAALNGHVANQIDMDTADPHTLQRLPDLGFWSDAIEVNRDRALIGWYAMHSTMPVVKEQQPHLATVDLQEWLRLCHCVGSAVDRRAVQRQERLVLSEFDREHRKLLPATWDEDLLDHLHFDASREGFLAAWTCLGDTGQRPIDNYGHAPVGIWDLEPAEINVDLLPTLSHLHVDNGFLLGRDIGVRVCFHRVYGDWAFTVHCLRRHPNKRKVFEFFRGSPHF